MAFLKRRSTMKSDIQLQRDVMDELAWVPNVEHNNIGVAAKGGVITLTGFVANYAQKMAAEHAAAGVLGVQAIAEELKVHFPSDAKISDTDIAGRIVDLFSWNVSIPHDKVSVKVEHGWVTLGGTVEWNYQREAAHTAAGHTAGVLGIIDDISVRNSPSTTDVRERIMAAFKRSSDVDGSSIKVTADRGTVTLGGNVHGWHERGIAERAAWGAPGVQHVDDKIVVI
jgi:osmotically-inducible protein OsmY